MLAGTAFLLALVAFHPQQAPDSATALRQAQELVLEHYDYYGITGRLNWVGVGSPPGCTGVSLQDCKQGDWSCLDYTCSWDHAERRAQLIPKLEARARVAGNSEWLFRQRVGFAIKNDELERADAIAHSCDDGEWWCQTLRGLTAHLLHPGDGLAHFDSAFVLVARNPRRVPSGQFAWGAGPNARCEWSDIRAVVPLEMLDEVRRSPCPEGEELRTRFWWLTDPLWTRDGNERYLEHLARQVMIRMDLDVQELLDAAAEEPQYESWMWESVDVQASYGHVVREGFPNSNTDSCWDQDRHDRVSRCTSNRGEERMVSYVHGGYSFALDDERIRRPLESTADDWAVQWEGEGCQPPWTVEGCGPRSLPRRRSYELVNHEGCQRPWTLEECGPERMITRERWHNLDHQAVVLRRGAQWFVVTAARVPEELGSLDGLQPALALGRVEELDLQIVPAGIDEDRTFRASTRVDTAAYLASIEAVGEEEIGRARFGAMPQPLTDGFGVSDLALLDPLFESGSLPLEQALLPSLDLAAGGHVGLYFEVYGLGEDEAIDFTLTSEKLNASLFHRLASRTRGVDLTRGWRV